MKTRIFILKNPDEPIRKTESLIIWLDYFGASAIATPDLICLIESFYFPN
jgi:hypothetical protein